jgi:CxxC-x17-CxxC domain-containing protein
LRFGPSFHILAVPRVAHLSVAGLPTAAGALLVQDKTLVCKDCSNQFIFTVRDQEFYIEKGFENEPQRCRDCRTQRKNSRSSASRRETLPFKPRGDRPVYCRTCFSALAPAAVH